MKTCLYHDELGDVVVDSDEVAEYLKQGFHESPKGYNQRAKEKVVQVAEMVSEAAQKVETLVDDSEDVPEVPRAGVNDPWANFDIEGVQGKVELEAYAKAKFGVDLDRRRTLAKLKAEVKALEAKHG